MNTNRTDQLITLLSSVAALSYSSWILGYVINPSVSLRGSASELAAEGQPLGLVFVFGDVIAASLIVTLVYVVKHNRLSRLPGASGHFYLLFGVFSALSALFSLTCSPISSECTALVYSYRFGLHYFLGVLATLSLLSSGIISAYRVKEKRFRLTLLVLIMIWLGLGVVGFAYSFGEMSAFLQRCFLCISAILIWLVPSGLLNKQQTES